MTQARADQRPHDWAAMVAEEHADVFRLFPDASDAMVAQMLRITERELRDCLRREATRAPVRKMRTATIKHERERRRYNARKAEERRRARERKAAAMAEASVAA